MNPHQLQKQTINNLAKEGYCNTLVLLERDNFSAWRVTLRLLELSLELLLEQVGTLKTYQKKNMYQRSATRWHQCEEHLAQLFCYCFRQV